MAWISNKGEFYCLSASYPSSVFVFTESENTFVRKTVDTGNNETAKKAIAYPFGTI